MIEECPTCKDGTCTCKKGIKMNRKAITQSLKNLSQAQRERKKGRHPSKILGDLNKDGKMSGYEKARQKAIMKAMSKKKPVGKRKKAKKKS